jgi:hypothetical protein
MIGPPSAISAEDDGGATAVVVVPEAEVGELIIASREFSTDAPATTTAAVGVGTRAASWASLDMFTLGGEEEEEEEEVSRAGRGRVGLSASERDDVMGEGTNFMLGSGAVEWRGARTARP